MLHNSKYKCKKLWKCAKKPRNINSLAYFSRKKKTWPSLLMKFSVNTKLKSINKVNKIYLSSSFCSSQVASFVSAYQRNTKRQISSLQESERLINNNLYHLHKLYHAVNQLVALKWKNATIAAVSLVSCYKQESGLSLWVVLELIAYYMSMIHLVEELCNARQLVEDGAAFKVLYLTKIKIK